MPLNLQINSNVGPTAQAVADQDGNATSLTLSDRNVGIGTLAASQRLTLGSGNVFLPTANTGVDGNLYFGGITDVGQIGMRLFGGDVNNSLPSGFIDVRAGTLTDGLIFRVDTFKAGAERMRITATGNVGIVTANPQEKLEVDGNIRVTGDVILLGADCAEDFDVEEADSLEPGSVMVIGEDGRLHQSKDEYDTRVAGVLSGAGDFRPGIVLDKREPRHDRLPLALTGKVFCKVDAEYSPIGVGDLLTTSTTVGHAMKADDPLRSHGSVIGKALRALSTGRGLIPILIALQ